MNRLFELSWQGQARLVAAALGFSFCQSRRERRFCGEGFVSRAGVTSSGYVYISLSGYKSRGWFSLWFKRDEKAQVTLNNCEMHTLPEAVRRAVFWTVFLLESPERAEYLRRFLEIPDAPTAHEIMERVTDFKGRFENRSRW